MKRILIPSMIIPSDGTLILGDLVYFPMVAIRSIMIYLTLRKIGLIKGDSYWGEVVVLTGDEDPTDEDVDIGLGDLTGVLAPSGDEISLGGKKSRESDIDGGTIAGGNNSMSNRYLVKSSEELGEMFPGEAGK
ncbi:hypothetical protein Tco_0720920 [Tanacetum coccineum]